MGKRIISQARGKGSFTYRIRKKAFRYRLGYPGLNFKGSAQITKLINSPAHSAPIAKLIIDKKVFYIPAAQGLYEGQTIEINNGGLEKGDIVMLKDIPIGTRIFNIEKRPGDGGKMVRTSGGFSTLSKKDEKGTFVLMSNKKEIKLNENCRVTIGTIAGQGRKTKPVIKAGKKHHMMKARSKKWHTTSAVKVNIIDHPFGGGRGKRIKSKIAKRDSPPGAKVGHISPRKTGKRKGRRR